MSKRRDRVFQDIELRKPKTPIYGKTQRRKVKTYMNSLNANYPIDEDYDDEDYDDEDEYEEDEYDEDYDDDEDY